MRNYNLDWMITFRNTRAVFVAVGLAGLLIWALILKKADDARTLLKTDTLIANVTKITVNEGTGSARSLKTYTVQLKLPDNKEIRFTLLSTAPKVGAHVPVLVDVYDDGKKYYYYNRIDWQVY